jgi:hypothetical protein
MSQELLGRILATIEPNLPAWKEAFRQEAACWAAYTIRYGTRWEITHDYDPPWDHSGELRKAKEGFDPSRYLTLTELLEEPSGERRLPCLSPPGGAQRGLARGDSPRARQGVAPHPES